MLVQCMDESLANKRYYSREGVIIKWPLNDLFNNGRGVIISSRMAISIVRYTSTTKSMLGRQLPKVTLVGNAIPPNEAFLG